jgi:TPR repeat protein
MEVMVAIFVFISLIGLVWFLSKRVQDKDDFHYMGNIQKSAQAGDAIAQYKLAMIYYEGNGVERDDAEAMKWLQKAAQQDHIEAQYVLGVMYEKGESVPKDDDQAYKWISMAARQGYARARVVLESDKWMGYAESRFGAGDSQGPSEGTIDKVTSEQIEEYLRKAEEGDVDAQYNLGIIYYHGEGAPRDFDQALAWFHKAAEQDDADAQYTLGFMYGRGEGVEKDQNQSVAWFKKAAEQGHTGAQEILEKMIKKGRG